MEKGPTDQNGETGDATVPETKDGEATEPDGLAQASSIFRRDF